MPIVFAQPSPVGAAGAVGAAQGAAAARGQNLQAQLAAAQLYSQHAARMAAIEEQSAGRFQSAAMLGAQLGERGFEAQMDFANQRARAVERQQEIQSQVAGNLMLQATQLTQKENLRLQQLKNSIADVGHDVETGKLTPEEGKEIMGQLKYQVSGLEVRKARAAAHYQEQQVQQMKDAAGLNAMLRSTDATMQAQAMDQMIVKNPDGSIAGWVIPKGVDFTPAPKPEQAKGIDVATELRIQQTAAQIIKDQHGTAWETYTPEQRMGLLNDEVRRVRMRMGMGQPPGEGGSEKPSINLGDQAELGKAEIANNPAIPQEIKVAAANAIDDAKRLLEAVGWDVNKLSKADREKYDRLKNFVRSLPKAPQQQPPQQPQPAAPRPAGPGEAVPGLSTGFGPADFIRRQIGG